MFTRMAIYALLTVFMCSANAQANETWTCIQKFENGTQFSGTVIITEDQLTYKGGKGGYTIFDNTSDHVLGAVVFRDKGHATILYILLERMSGRMIEFDDLQDDGFQIKFKSDCTRER